jgi:5-methylcytosine-specific restriction endonuclease McrA
MKPTRPEKSLLGYSASKILMVPIAEHFSKRVISHIRGDRMGPFSREVSHDEASHGTMRLGLEEAALLFIACEKSLENVLPQWLEEPAVWGSIYSTMRRVDRAVKDFDYRFDASGARRAYLGESGAKEARLSNPQTLEQRLAGFANQETIRSGLVEWCHELVSELETYVGNHIKQGAAKEEIVNTRPVVHVSTTERVEVAPKVKPGIWPRVHLVESDELQELEQKFRRVRGPSREKVIMLKDRSNRLKRRELRLVAIKENVEKIGTKKISELQALDSKTNPVVFVLVLFLIIAATIMGGLGGMVIGVLLIGFSLMLLEKATRNSTTASHYQQEIAGHSQVMRKNVTRSERLLASVVREYDASELLLDRMKIMARDEEREQWDDYAGYPPDWEIRRKEVFSEICGRECSKCGYKPEGALGERDLHVHHVIPLRKGGTHRLENLVPLCDQCHKEVDSVHARQVITRKERRGRK